MTLFPQLLVNKIEVYILVISLNTYSILTLSNVCNSSCESSTDVGCEDLSSNVASGNYKTLVISVNNIYY